MHYKKTTINLKMIYIVPNKWNKFVHVCASSLLSVLPLEKYTNMHLNKYLFVLSLYFIKYSLASLYTIGGGKYKYKFISLDSYFRVNFIKRFSHDIRVNSPIRLFTSDYVCETTYNSESIWCSRSYMTACKWYLQTHMNGPCAKFVVQGSD